MPTSKHPSIKDNSPLGNLFGKPEAAIAAVERQSGSARATPRGERKSSREKSAEPQIPAPVAAVRGEDAEPRQTTILLYDDQLDWLDRMCTAARQHKGKAIRKAAIIRTLIDLAMAANPDLRGLQSEAEILVRVEKAIRAR